MSDPEDGNEWVELYNMSDSEVDLVGWTLEDGISVFETFDSILGSESFIVSELSSNKLKPLKLTKAPSSKIVRDKKLYKAIKIKQPKKIRKIRVAKLPTMKVSKGGFLT